MPCSLPGPDSQKNGNAGGARSAAAAIRNGIRQIGLGRLADCLITATMATPEGPLAYALTPPRSNYLGGGGGGAPGGGGGMPQFCGSLTTRGWYAMPAGTGTEWPLTYMHWM